MATARHVEHGVKHFVVSTIQEETFATVPHNIAEKYARVLQTSWRKRNAKILVDRLRQQRLCQLYQDMVRKGEDLSGQCRNCCCPRNASTGQAYVDQHAFASLDKLLFRNVGYTNVENDGSDWNKRFQRTLELPEETESERFYKYHLLSQLNRDFVSAATEYGMVIISELFLHMKDKSIRPRHQLGGIAGGAKYLWRGILFKLADGKTGPYGGCDECAARAAGADLRGASHFYACGVPGLHVALQCLIDYKGFRISAQALLPLKDGSLKVGSADAGSTIHNDDPECAAKLRAAAKALNVRSHACFSASGQRYVLDHAVDVEGHKGIDGRCYVLDTARTFPPEAPEETQHLSHIMAVGTYVMVQLEPSTAKRFGQPAGAYMPGFILRVKLRRGAYFYDVLRHSPSHHVGAKAQVLRDVPAKLIHDSNLTIFWRFLRPEFVKRRGDSLSEAASGWRLSASEAAVLSLAREKSSRSDSHEQTPSLAAVNVSVDLAPDPPSVALASAQASAIDVSIPSRRGTGLAARLARFRNPKGNGDDSSNRQDVEFVITFQPTRPAVSAWTLTRTFAQLESFSDSLVEYGEDIKPPFPRTRKRMGLGKVGMSKEERRRRVEEWLRALLPSLRSASLSVISKTEAFFARETKETGSTEEAREAREADDTIEGPERLATGRHGGSDSDFDGDKRPLSFRRHSRQDLLNAAMKDTKFGESSDEEDEEARSTAGQTVSASFRASADVVGPGETPDEHALGTGAYGGFMEPVATTADSSAASAAVDGMGDDDWFAVGRAPTSAEYSAFSELTGCSYGYSTPGASTDNQYGVVLDNPTPSTDVGRSGSLTEPTSEARGYAPGPDESTGICNGSVTVENNGDSSEPASQYGMGMEDQGVTRVHVASAASEDVQRESCIDPGLVVFEDHFSAQGSAPSKTSELPGHPLHSPRTEGVVERAPAPPLSADAFASFSSKDPEAPLRNGEVRDATRLLIKETVPLLAQHLLTLDHEVLEHLDLSVELHRHGVNIRHLGLLRSLLKPHSSQPAKACDILRRRILQEVVARTLKKILRDFQRKWMRAMCTASTQGMHLVVVQFFNLVTGAHVASEEFWSEQVVTGLYQRFGRVTLSKEELRPGALRARLLDNRVYLKGLLTRLVALTGVKFTETVSEQLRNDPEPSQFQFVLDDIVALVPLVKYMHIIDFSSGVHLGISAYNHRVASARGGSQSRNHTRCAQRLELYALNSVSAAHRAMPLDRQTSTLATMAASALPSAKTSTSSSRPHFGSDTSFFKRT